MWSARKLEERQAELHVRHWGEDLAALAEDAAQPRNGHFRWTREETLSLADNLCTSCWGVGLRMSRAGVAPCGCVLREIFRQCLRRYHVYGIPRMSPTWEAWNGRKRRQGAWGWRGAEYRADFWRTARRALRREGWEIFRLHFLEGAGWRPCARRMKITRGEFFHAIYKIQARVGRALREVRPYPIYPLEDYWRRRGQAHASETD